MFLLRSLKSSAQTIPFLALFIAISNLGFSSISYGWGSRGHQIVGSVGGNLATNGQKFWAANKTLLGEFANIPDNLWKTGQNANLERPMHWLEIDFFFKSPDQFGTFPKKYSEAVAAYGEAAVIEHGMAHWRAQQLYNLAVEAIKKGDYQTGLEMAGTMAHYVGDLSQPLHVTTNYDGQESNNKGIHKFFEVTVVNTVDISDLENEVTQMAQALLKDESFLSQFKGDFIENLIQQVSRSYAKKDQILKIDTELGRKDEGVAAQMAIVKPRLADGAATYAMILSKLWDEAGSPNYSEVMKSSKPAWVPAKFSRFQKSGYDKIMQVLADRDQCKDHIHAH